MVTWCGMIIFRVKVGRWVGCDFCGWWRVGVCYRDADFASEVSSRRSRPVLVYWACVGVR